MIARHFGKKRPTKAALMSALQANIIMRESLDNIEHTSLCRSYGVAAAELDALIATERQRRGASS